MVEKGLIIVFTGHGKGKTTAALGMALRAIGHDLSVVIIQFIKGSWEYGELKLSRSFHNLEIIPMGRGFVHIDTPSEEDVEAARRALETAKEKMCSGSYHMVILDEVTYAINYGLIKVEEVMEMIEEKPLNLHLVLTGRDCPEEIIQAAHLVTEMREIKHPYRNGIKGQKGIEY